MKTTTLTQKLVSAILVYLLIPLIDLPQNFNFFLLMSRLWRYIYQIIQIRFIRNGYYAKQ